MTNYNRYGNSSARTAILRRLSAGPATIADLKAELRLGHGSVQWHLDVLRRAGRVVAAPYNDGLRGRPPLFFHLVSRETDSKAITADDIIRAVDAHLTIEQRCDVAEAVKRVGFGVFYLWINNSGQRTWRDDKDIAEWIYRMAIDMDAPSNDYGFHHNMVHFHDPD